MKYKGILFNGLYIISCLIVLDFIVPKCAYAYLDPNTGSMVLQMIIAAIAALGLSFKVWKDKFLSFIKTIIKGRKNGN